MPRAAALLVVLACFACHRHAVSDARAPEQPACPPVEVGPNKWITPLCGELPAVATVPYVHKHGFIDKPLPLAVDLRAFDGPVRDQGQVGVCWAFALSAVMDNGARRAGYSDAMMSSLHVIAKKGTWEQMWRGRQSPPLTVEQLWPYDPRKSCAFNDDPREAWCEREYGIKPSSWRSNPQLVAELGYADVAHQFVFRDTQHLETRPANIEQLASVLADGQAIWASFAFNRHAWSFTELRDGVFSDYTADREYGHAVEIVGYRTTLGGKEFLLKNSWGSDWGQGGYAWMSEHLVRRHLKSAFRLRVAASRGGQAPAPLPGPTPVPGPAPVPAYVPVPVLHLPGLALPKLSVPVQQWPLPDAACRALGIC